MVPAATITTMLGITTVFLHRAETHGSIKLKPPVRFAARMGTWLLSGMKPREWVGVHGRHHDNTDTPEDPHSPIQNGRFGVAKVLFGNVPMYRRAAKQLTPGDYPAQLEPDKWDKLLFDRGILGQIALGGILTAVAKGNLKKSMSWLAVHDVAMFIAGGVVNGSAHSGQARFSHALLHEPVPDENGNYARNMTLAPTLATVGEGSHLNHHEDPSRMVFNDNPWRDPGGLACLALMKLNLAELPEARPADVRLQLVGADGIEPSTKRL